MNEKTIFVAVIIVFVIAMIFVITRMIKRNHAEKMEKMEQLKKAKQNFNKSPSFSGGYGGSSFATKPSGGVSSRSQFNGNQNSQSTSSTNSSTSSGDNSLMNAMMISSLINSGGDNSSGNIPSMKVQEPTAPTEPTASESWSGLPPAEKTGSGLERGSWSGITQPQNESESWSGIAKSRNDGGWSSINDSSNTPNISVSDSGGSSCSSSSCGGGGCGGGGD